MSRGVAVVTGASGGVGRATTRALAEAGYDVGLLARGEAGLEGAAEDVRRVGGRALAVPTDVSVFDEVDQAADRVTEALGPIDVWVNDAMTTIFAPVVEIEPDEIRRATEVTYLGQVYGAMAALARMRPRDQGTIISVGSALAYRGIPLQSAYCASKFAVRGFMESLRTELLEEGSNVEVVQVHLPAVNTTQFGWCRARTSTHPMPVPPIYQPEVPAHAIVAAIDSGPRQRIVGTWNWMMVQMSQAMPGIGDHYLARTGRQGQLTDIPIAADRPDDLFKPLDGDRDHRSHGIFDDQSGGVLDPHFLRTLPHTAREFGLSVRDRVGEVRARRGAQR